MTTQRSALLTILCLLAHSLQISALIVSPSRPAATGQVVAAAAKSKSKSNGSSTPKISSETKVVIARIRSTRRSDVDPVANLLSTAIFTGNDGEDTTNNNWNARVERLRSKSSIRTTLALRVRAIEEGKKHILSQRVVGTTSAVEQQLTTNPNCDLRYLWSTNDSFRSNIKQAAELSSEPHPWEHHNFASAPKDPSWLRHEMISAQDTATGEIIGFCEIAMLLCPPLLQSTTTADDNNSIYFSYGDDYDDDEEDECSTAAPTIANLVVCPTWRRRGVAKGLIKSAARIVARKWKCDELGLYVEKTNQRAMKLYESGGFDVKAVLDERGSPTSSKWYMSKPLL